MWINEMTARDAARAGRTTGLARIKAWRCATGGPRRGAERRTPNAGRTAMRDAPSGTRHAAHNAGAADAPAHGAPASRPNNTAARCDRASRARRRVTHRGRPSQPRIAAITRFTAGARTPAGRRRFEQAPARSATLRPDAARRAPPSRAGRPLANSPAESAD
ncbi:hypothetical protein AQ932_22130 [Burkholderia pseudomallei]|nr:hypothetical protein AQ855_16700 [Burkholderia pseudomallei]OMY97281.1 hypothetical protein AQ856_08910 [Burkholderia pseudomallei]OMZ03202.1 hypothetical protein AQ854_23690 [Burkholderia pseudomallei]OMZ85155.1 hypothetical protein AQ870_05615 [Burkholderia pseudomallei]OND34832.1 hypothetical protein AQ931_03390 [Burkholderia pseudomallei]